MLKKTCIQGSNGDVRMRRKVVIIAPTPAPYRAYEYDRVQNELREEYEFHVLFLNQKWSDMNWAEDLPKNVKFDVLPEICLPRMLRRIPGLARVNSRVISTLNSVNPDAIITHGYDAPAFWLAYLWAIRKKRAILFRSDSNIAKEVNRPKSFFRDRIKKLLLSFLFKRIDAFLTLGSANEAYYEQFGAMPERFFRSCYMVDVDMYSLLADRERMLGMPTRAKLGVKQDKVLLFVGRFVWEKDLETVVEAFQDVLASTQNVALVLVGDGPLKSKLECLTESIRGNVYFVGFCQPEEIGAIYGASNALILASVQEAWGLVVNEAMAAGVPVLCSDRVGAGADLVVESNTGKVFSAGNVKAISAAMKSVLASSKACLQMGRAGRMHLKEWSTKNDAVRGYKDALRYAIGISK